MEFTLPPLIGHRGAARVAPENTLPGLAAAAEAGVRWVELDVKLTADDVAILMHDDRLDRTTDRRGPVRGTTWAQLAGADAGGHARRRPVRRQAPRPRLRPLPFGNRLFSLRQGLLLYRCKPRG